MWRFQFTFRVIIQLGLLSVAWGQYSVIFLTVEWRRGDILAVFAPFRILVGRWHRFSCMSLHSANLQGE